MPIEDPEKENKTNELMLKDPIFSTRNVIVAGQIKVKHPLLDKPLILYGFVIEDAFFNENDFRIAGSKIKYKSVYDDKYLSNNEIIFPKIVIDNKQTPFYNLFNNLEEIIQRLSNRTDYYSKTDVEESCLFEYYMFDKVNTLMPVCAANEIYAVCKYLEDATFKYALFCFHELSSE